MYHPRIETADYASFLTTRTQASELWFVNNKPLEEAILGYLAKFSARYHAKLYAFAIEGDHVHHTAEFPELNRSAFMRDLNSSIARAVPRYVENYRGGRLWGRRYSCEYLIENADIEDRFFYTVLQPVQDGLVERISDYPGYNCFHDAVNGITREFKVIRWGDYNAARRFNPRVAIKDYTDIVELKYERLPGYESLSQKEYADLMNKKLEERRAAIVNQRLAEGKSFLGRTRLLQVLAGSKPKNTKRSHSNSYRPRILSVTREGREEGKAWYFTIYGQYREASERYRNGELDVEFPPGTYRPPQVCLRSPPEQRV